MIKRLLRNYYIKNSLVIGFILLVIISSIVNSYINYQTNKSILYQNIDNILKTAALNTKLLLGEKFFDRATKKGAISPKEDMKNILKLAKLAKNSNVEYVYTMIERGSNIYFTSSSAKEDEINTSYMTKYFDLYDEATPLLKSVLKINKISFEESTDKWGTFRSIFIPQQTKNGNKYILGADIKIDYINKKLDSFIKNIFATQLVIITILSILGFYFIKISKKELNEIKFIKDELDKEIEEKTLKLQLLNNTLETKVKEEVEKNRLKDQQLLQQNRLAQMGEMISMIAHQWRQPLSAISSASGALKLKAKLNHLDNKVVSELADKITQFAKHLSQTIDDFRNFFKPNKEKQMTTFDDLISSSLNIIEASITSKNIQIIKDLRSDKTILTYPNEVKQVILNLLKNAEDILVEKKIKDPKIIIRTYDNILEIEDNAGGVPTDIIDKIFDPYFTTKTKKDGTGLGLYMSKIIIEEHCKGELSVINSKEGAIFRIILDFKTQST